MTTTITPATPDDGPAILTLLAASGLPEAGVLAHLDHAFIARSGASIVGCAALEMRNEGAFLRSVAVAPEARGAGLGQRLVATALGHAREAGLPAVFLLTTTAEAFFERFGFARVDRARIPADVRASEEFQGTSCASAVAMRLAWRASDATATMLLP